MLSSHRVMLPYTEFRLGARTCPNSNSAVIFKSRCKTIKISLNAQASHPWELSVIQLTLTKVGELTLTRSGRVIYYHEWELTLNKVNELTLTRSGRVIHHQER